MNLTLNAVKNSAFLANKTYEDKAKLDKYAKNNGGTIPNPATNSSFEVVKQVNDDTTGFSGAVFKDPVSGEYAIAFRGAEVGNGKISV